MGELRKLCVLLILVAWVGTALAQQKSALALSRLQAIELALSSAAGNTQFRESLEELDRQQARRRQARSNLLPQISARLRQSSQTINLEALGLRPEGLFRPPSLVGPFSTFDARLRLNQTLFSFSTIENLRASDWALNRELEETRYTRDQIASQVSRFYVTALRHRAQLEASQARIDLAHKLLELAHRQRTAGLGTAIEETRASLEVSRAEQQLLGSQLKSENALLQLAHFLALELDQVLDLTDPMDETSPLAWTYPRALEKALGERKDLRAMEAAILEVRSNLKAVRATRLPELHGFAEYGTVGSSLSNTIPTWAVGVELEIPIFSGGRTSAQVAEALSLLRSRELAVGALRRQIALETRLGLARLHLTARQLAISADAQRLAGDEVARAQRRYRAGITTNLEVVQSQTNLKDTANALVAARYEHQLARISVGEILGIILSELP